MRIHLAVFLFVGLTIELTANGASDVAGQILPAAHAQEAPAEVLAAQLRRQGHRCEGPVKAERDAELSRPDMAVWIIRCTNASYRMRLIPNMAAQVEQM